MAPALASIDLVLLTLLVLSLAVLETPVPRCWAFAAAALLTVQTYAVHAMDEQGVSPGAQQSDAIVHSVPEALGLLAVPALTSALLTVVFYYCARAYARAKRRLELSLRAQAIGSDMPTG